LLKLFYTHKSFIKSLFWRALQIIARNGFSYVIFYLASLFLPEEDFGFYNYILKMAFFITLFIDFGISMSVGKYTAEYNALNKEKINPLLSNNILAIFFIAFPVMLITAGFAVFLFGGQYKHLLHLLPLLLLVPLTSLFDAVFRGLKRFKELSIITFLTGSISMLCFYFLIKKYELTGAFYAQNVFYLSLLTGLWFTLKIKPKKFNKALFKEHYKYALIIGVIGIFMFFSTQVDVLFLGHYGYLKEVAYYEIISRFLTLLMMPFVIIGHVVAPDFTRHYVSGNYKWVKQKLKISILSSFMLSVLLCVVLYFVMPYIFQFFFDKYNTYALHKMFNIMLLLFFTNMFNGFIPLIAIATGHARWGMYYITIVGVLNVVFDYYFINYGGVWELIYATVILKSCANVMFVGYYYFKLPR